MTAFWHDPQSEHLVAAHIAGDQPAWLWEADSERLVWRNRAAIAYEQAERRQTHDRVQPVPRQIARAVRMGVPHLTSRARLQFTIGRKPVSATCSCTPLHLGGHVPALLVVMQNAVSADALALVEMPQDSIAPFVDRTCDYAVIDAAGETLIGGGDGARRAETGEAPYSSLPVGNDARLIVFPEAIPDFSAEPALPAADTTRQSDETALAETGQEADELPASEDMPAETEPGQKSHTGEEGEALVHLIDQLDSRQVLYAPLDESDDGTFPQQAHVGMKDKAEPPAVEGIEGELTETEFSGFDSAEADGNETDIAAPSSDANEQEESSPAATNDAAETADVPQNEKPDEAHQSAARKLWKVVGRGLNLLQAGKHTDIAEDLAPGTENAMPKDTEPEEALADPDEHSDATSSILSAIADRTWPEIPSPDHNHPPGAEASFENGDEPDIDQIPDRVADILTTDNTEIEQTSRYNFDELSRILNDRVSGTPDPNRGRTDLSDSAGAGSLVNLGDETLILNRLPIGLLVFRDQQILFNNRAFTDLLGYLDGTSLRRAGLAGVFPPEGDQETAGPITRLMGADGRVFQVSARLQSISWQGRPALMLSANRHKEPLNAEVMARGFASGMANALELGYFETSRAGIISSVSGQAAILSHRSPDTLIGRPLHSLIAHNEGTRLRSFLEEPARFAGGERPSIRLDGTEPGTEIVVFAEGMAGIVAGYFGFIRARTHEATDAGGHHIDPDFLIRLSRAMRQPVNAIVGFSEMIRNEAFGPISESRYADYGRFIHGAGRDIASMIDELEDYARLREEDYPLDISAISLSDLLYTAITRARPFAATTRVFLRSSISANLPEISADAETLTQAVLNILATAIAHSPPGGQVVLSAQRRGDGAVEVHVRDSGKTGDASDSGFMVFRDGEAKDGGSRAPAESAIGLALTRTLVAVNAMSLDIDPDRGSGTLFSLNVPADLVARADTATS